MGRHGVHFLPLGFGSDVREGRSPVQGALSQRAAGRVRALQRNRTNRNSREREREKERRNYFKELAHTTVEAGKFTTRKAGQQTGGPGKSRRCGPSLQTVSRQDFLFFSGDQFFLLRPSTDWMRPSHFREYNLLLLKVCYFKC